MVTKTSHIKLFNERTVPSKQGDIIIEGPVPADLLAETTFHPGLRAFRPAADQQQAIIEIAQLPEGRIIIARIGSIVVGYVTFLYPDPLERWSEAGLANLLELGAIEVAADFRGMGLAKKMLEVSFLDDSLNDYIVYSTEYYWHWDLAGTGLSVWEYKEVMKKVMGSVGLEFYATDDPEITCHPANMLMARIGNRVSQDAIELFHEIRFKNRHMF